MQMMPPAGHFSCFVQEKYPKEADLGEALTVKSIGLQLFPAYYPDFKPPSPKYPSRPLRVS